MLMYYVLSVALRLSNPNLMEALCYVETRNRNILNPDDVGSPSYGHCQVKEGTSTWMHVRYKMEGTAPTPNDLMVKEIGVMYASLYLKFQQERYKGDLRCAISAYNGGKCLKSNQKTYVDKVLKRLAELELKNGKTTNRSEFVRRPDHTKSYPDVECGRSGNCRPSRNPMRTAVPRRTVPKKIYEIRGAPVPGYLWE